MQAIFKSKITPCNEKNFNFWHFNISRIENKEKVTQKSQRKLINCFFLDKTAQVILANAFYRCIVLISYLFR